MNELTLVARLRQDIPAETDLTGPERRLAAEICAAPAPSVVRSRLRGTRRYRRRLALAGTLAGTLAAALAVAVAVVQSQPTSPSPSTAGRPGPPAAPIRGPAATSAAQLVAYATRAAAAAPAFDPKPHQWIYIKELAVLYGNTGTPIGPPYKLATFQYWTRVDYRQQARINHGKLVISDDTSRGGFIGGWPFGHPVNYAYLDSLPASPAKLKAIIAANIGKRSIGVGTGDIGIFNAIEALMVNAVLSPRLDASFYRLLATLHGVHFDPSATDIAGRPNIGFYTIQYGYYKDEIMINPTTYAYMGGEAVATKAHTDFASDGVHHYHKGQLLGWLGEIQAGIVQRAGQVR